MSIRHYPVVFGRGPAGKKQPVPARDGMLVEKGTRGTPPVPARDGMWSERPYLAQGKTGGWTQPRQVSAMPLSFTFRPGRDG
ncbi:MAG: hypothetical protein LBJ01_02775 [Tannerella sp.]|nr:hypothetical protein [Tannerella sp.]